MRDVKVILNSHVHYDHAGGIAELQMLSGAKVIASDIAAKVLRTGKGRVAFRDLPDPQPQRGEVLLQRGVEPCDGFAG